MASNIGSGGYGKIIYGQGTTSGAASPAGYGQARADIKATSNKFGQANADIKQTNNAFGQAQTQVVRRQGYGQAQAKLSPVLQYGHGSSAAFPSFGITTTANNVVVVYVGARDGNSAQWTPASPNPVFSEVSAWDVDAGQATPNDPLWLLAAHSNSSLTQVDGTFTNTPSNLAAGAIELSSINFSGIVGGASTHGYAAFGGSHAVASDTLTPDSNTTGIAICVVGIRGDAGGGGLVPSAGWKLLESWAVADHPTETAFYYVYSKNSGSIQLTTTISNDDRYWSTVIGLFPSGTSITAGYGQAQCYIKPNGYAQAQADIKQTYNQSAQANADIKKVQSGFGQALALIAQFSFGQAQCYITTKTPNAQAQTQIIGRLNKFAQAQTDIKQIGSGSGQANASITSKTPSGQAQALINQVFHTGQANADIKVLQTNVANAQALIKRFSIKSAQAQAWIKTDKKNGSGQAQTSITKRQGYGQSQCSVALYKGSGQAQTVIKVSRAACGNSMCFVTKTQGYGQAMAAINHGGSGQANALIRVGNNKSGQACCFIRKSIGIGQANALISGKITNTGLAISMVAKSAGYGQAQSVIKTINPAFGQAQVFIGHMGYAQAQALINSNKYVVKFNNFNLPGYAQTEAFVSSEQIAEHKGPFEDSTFSEYIGLENKLINLKMKVLSETFSGAKEQTQAAGTILRSAKGFSKLYIQYQNKYYLALTRKFDVENEAKTNTNFSEYNIEWEAKPWLYGETTYTVSGLDIFDTGSRNFSNGGWTPARIKVSGTDVTISGYNELGEFAGFISVSGAVNNLLINSEAYTATIGGVNKNNLMNNLDYALYIGPGKTTFVVSGATLCEISWEDRWYL